MGIKLLEFPQEKLTLFCGFYCRVRLPGPSELIVDELSLMLLKAKDSQLLHNLCECKLPIASPPPPPPQSYDHLLSVAYVER